MKKKTNDDFIKELNEKFPNIIPLDNYINAITKEHFGGDIKLYELLLRDLNLRNYCISHNMRLLEIPYYLKDDKVREAIKHFLE